MSLAPEHLDALKDSGISLDVAKSAGILSVAQEEAASYGYNSSGMYIPYWDPQSQKTNGFFRFRLDNPTDGTKYLQPKKSGSKLYFASAFVVDSRQHEQLLRKHDLPLFIVEGEKKALSLAQRLGNRALVLGIGGCWNWSKKKTMGGPRPLIEDFDAVWLKGRKVYVAFDSDIAINYQVRTAESEMARSLRARGSTVKLLTLPHDDEGKAGMDDLLVRWGDDWEEELAELCKTAVEARIDIPRIYRLEELLTETFPPIRIVLGDESLPILNSSGLCYIHSTSGVGKTYFSLQLAHSLANGSPFLGYLVPRPLRVVFLQAELSGGWFQRRTRSLADTFGSTDNLYIMNGQMNLAVPAEYGKYEVQLSPLEAIVRDFEADVVVIDPLQGYLDIPENSTDVNREFQRRLSALRHKYDCAVIVTHHDRKAGQGEGMHRMRGSSVLSDWADCVLQLSREPRVEDGEVVGWRPDKLILEFDKVRHAEGPRPDQVRLCRLTSDGRQLPWMAFDEDQDFDADP